jgi:hypothetical protein
MWVHPVLDIRTLAGARTHEYEDEGRNSMCAHLKDGSVGHRDLVSLKSEKWMKRHKERGMSKERMEGKKEE